MQYQLLFDESIELLPGADVASSTGAIPSGAGVCLLCDGRGEPILLLYGAQLRAILRRRLAEAAPGQKTRRADLKSITARVWFRRCWSAFETQWSYYQIAKQIYPDRFPEFFPRLNAWFLQIRLEDRYPGFRVMEGYSPKNGLQWGPFGSKKTAHACLETLQDLFSLCRCVERLVKSPQEEPCSYGQIRRCLNVCTGQVDPEEYRRVLQQAIAFMDRPIEETLAQMQQRMKELAAELRFEEAQALKRQLRLAGQISTSLTRWVTRMESFYLFSFHSGPLMKLAGSRKLQPSVTGFFIGPGWLKAYAPIAIQEVETRCAEMRSDFLRVQDSLAEAFAASDPAVLGWTSNFLYRNRREQGLFVWAASITDAGELARRVSDYFARKQTNTKKPRLDTASLTENACQTEDGAK